MNKGDSSSSEPEELADVQTDQAGVVQVKMEDLRPSIWREMRITEDWWAVWLGLVILLLTFSITWWARPGNFQELLASDAKVTIVNPLKSVLSLPKSWTSNPVDSLYKVSTADSKGVNALPGILGAFVILSLLFGGAMAGRGKSVWAFLKAFPVVFLLGLFSYMLAEQSVIEAYNLEYALWALMVGLIISNSVGPPAWLKPAVQTEFYIKTGLVLLGAEVLMSRLLELGLPGVLSSWIVTPVVLVLTFIFGQRVLKMQSKSLNMVISADMSVCGVSAAIATGAACKAKKEELTLAIGLSLTFTVLMMVLMPMFIKAVGMDEIVAGAWLGGTIDSTGAVAAAGAVLGDRALETAATVKMIQNILIGVVAFVVAVYWVTKVENDPSAPRPTAVEIWYRFPKFVLGFVLVSILFSTLYELLPGGPELVDSMIGSSTKVLRGWLFCLAFVSIGLDTNFRELMPYLRTGKPLVLYVVGQTLNLILSFLMVYLMFGVLFKDVVK